MLTVAVRRAERQEGFAAGSVGPQPSAYGGVLVVAQAWAALGGAARLSRGVRWQGRAGGLLLFALVVLPLLPAGSLLAISTLCAVTADPLWAALGWAHLVTQRRLTRFVASPRHDWVQIVASMAQALVQQPALQLPASGIIAVDSTTIEKRFGPHLPDRRPVYDAVRRRLVDGYEVVSACAVGPTQAIPLGLLPHRKAATADERTALKRRRRKAQPGEWPSKLDQALELIHLGVRAGVNAETVVGDSAFAVMWWLREVAALPRQWLVATRQDRRLRIGAVIGTVREWATTVSPVAVVTDPRGRSIWGALLPEAVLLERHCRRKGLACRPVYFERRNRQGQVVHRWYLVTSQLTWDLATVWQQWSRRWTIEVLHRESKQLLGLNAFHVRNWEGIVALIAAASLRASVLWAMKALDPTCAALSTEALVAGLRKAACLVEQPADGPARAQIPLTLPATVLWQETHKPLPAPWWTVVLHPT